MQDTNHPGTMKANAQRAETAITVIDGMRFDSIIRLAGETLAAVHPNPLSTDGVRMRASKALTKDIIEGALDQDTRHRLSASLMHALNAKRLRRALRRLVAEGLVTRSTEEGRTLWTAVADAQETQS